MSAAMKLDAERAAFEAWAISKGYTVTRDAADYYLCTFMRKMWMAWQAARTPPQGELSALPELPEAVDTVRALMRNEWEYLTPDGYYYTADQMRAYGLLCRQSSDAADKRDAGSYLLPGDLAALQRFHECAMDFDSGGHDVSRQSMSRLTEIGVCRHIGFGNHQTTAFGDYVLERSDGGQLKLPLKTLAERNADAAIAQRQEGGND